jgi:hypothetical protein
MQTIGDAFRCLRSKHVPCANQFTQLFDWRIEGYNYSYNFAGMSNQTSFVRQPQSLVPLNRHCIVVSNDSLPPT